MGFEIGWLLWLSRLTGFAANCNLFITFLSYFWPNSVSVLWRSSVVSIIIAFFTVINIVGIRKSVITTNLITIAKLLSLMFFITAGLFFISTNNYSFTTHPSYDAFSTSVLLLIYMFSGFEVTGIPAGEIQEPKRNLPFACLFAIPVVTLIYIMIQFVCIGTFPGLATSERPLADASQQFLGAAGFSIITFGAMISIAGNLNGGILGSPRLLFAMSQQHQLPGFLSCIHKKFRTPHFAILISAAVMLVFTISTTFMSALITATFIRLIIYAATCIALLVFRSKKNIEKSMFKAPFGVVISIISLAFVGWLLSNTTWNEVRAVCIMAVAGLLIHFVFKLMQRKTSTRSVHDSINKVVVEIN